MSEYKLIKKLDTDEPIKEESNIKYTDFTVIVDGISTEIGIPERVIEDFKPIAESEKEYTRRTFRALLREYRGIRK